MQIKKSFHVSGTAIIWIGILLMCAFAVLLWNLALPPVWFLIITFLGVLLIVRVTENYYDSIPEKEKKKINDWKKEHPNDPRGKYL